MRITKFVYIRNYNRPFLTVPMPNFIQQIGAKLTSLVRGERSRTTNIWGMSTTAVYPTADSTTAVEKGFNSNAAVYSIVKKAAKKFGAIPRYVESASTQKADDAEALPGPLADLLNRPNPNEGQDAFFSKLYAFYKVCGEVFIWLNRGNTDVLIDDNLSQIDDLAHSKKPVLEMYVLPSNQMVIIPDPNDPFGITGYQLSNRPDIKFRTTDIIHWKDICLNWDLASRPQTRGMSPLIPGNKILETNNSATDATVQMNHNGGSKGALLNDMAGTPTQATAVADVLDNKVNNINHKGAVISLQGKWTYTNMGLSSVDMDLLKGKQLSMQELCFLMGMPYEFFDSQVTYANKQEAQKGWVINEIIPDCKQFDGELNRVLLIAFGLQGTGIICSDFDDLPELQEDKKTQIEWLMKGPFTVNEVREAVGYDKSTEDGADEVLIPSGVGKLADLGGDGGQAIMDQLMGSKTSLNGKPKVSANANG